MILIDKEVLMSDMGAAQGCWISCAVCGKINCLVGEVIDRQPAIEAEPLRYGKWIKKKVDPPIPNIPEYYYVCSECDKSGMIHDKYCRNCGAKMDGGISYGIDE